MKNEAPPPLAVSMMSKSMMRSMKARTPISDQAQNLETIEIIEVIASSYNFEA